MQIDSIEVFHIALPLRQPQETAAGGFETLETVLVRMQSGETAGWGEASPGNAPAASAEWAAGAFACLRDWLAPVVAGTAVDSGDQLAERLEPFHGNRFAKAALDTAWWDLSARQQEKPLHELLGGCRETIEIGTTFDRMDSIDEFLAAIGRALQDGFSRVRLMFRPGWDIQMVDAVRKEFPTAMLHVDAEGALGLQHMDTIHRLEDFGLAMVEQPFAPDDPIAHAMAQESMHTPICLDEGVTTAAQADVALELKSCRYMNVTQGRVGGLTAAVAIHDACRAAEVPCFSGAMPQSGIGARAGLALAAKENFTYPADFFPAADVLQQDLVAPLLPEREDSDAALRIALWAEPGIGAEPDPELLEKFCLARAGVSPRGGGG